MADTVALKRQRLEAWQTVMYQTEHFVVLSDRKFGAVVARRDDPSEHLYPHPTTVDAAKIAVQVAEAAYAIGARTLRVP